MSDPESSSTLRQMVRECLTQQDPAWQRLRAHIRDVTGYPVSEARQFTALIKEEPLFPRSARKNLRGLRKSFLETYRKHAKTAFETFGAVFAKRFSRVDALRKDRDSLLTGQKPALSVVRDLLRRITALLLDIQRRLRQNALH